MTTPRPAGSVPARVVTTAVLICAGVVGLEARQQLDPAELQRHARTAERALAEGRYAEAQKAYEALREPSPATAEVHAQLGVIYFQQGKFVQAIPALREAIRLKPGLPKVDALLAMSLSELGQYEEALPATAKHFAVVRSCPAADGWASPAADLHRTRPRSGRRGRRLALVASLTR